MDLPTRYRTPESALRAVLPRSSRPTGRQFQNLRPSFGHHLAMENRTGTIFQTDTSPGVYAWDREAPECRCFRPFRGGLKPGE